MISVIVPAYNVEKTIEKTLASIVSQTYKDLEIIVVNDGSKDKTGAIVEAFGEKNTQLRIIHIPNSGVTEARLTGVAASRGEWIGFVDGDDEIEADMYELLLRNAKKYKADISHCGYQMIFGDGRISYFHNTGDLIQQDTITGLKDLLDGTRVEPGLWNKLYHRSLFHILLDTSIMNKTIKINEDLLMNIILFNNSKISVFEDICKYHYIVREESVTRKRIDKHRIYDPIKVKEIILELIPSELKKDAKKAYLSTCINCYNSIILEYHQTLREDKIEIKKLIKEKRSWITLLNKKQKLLAYMILHFSWCYSLIYKIYARYFLNNPYK